MMLLCIPGIFLGGSSNIIGMWQRIEHKKIGFTYSSLASLGVSQHFKHQINGHWNALRRKSFLARQGRIPSYFLIKAFCLDFCRNRKYVIMRCKLRLISRI